MKNESEEKLEINSDYVTSDVWLKIDKLKYGDKVLFKKKPYIFLGIDEFKTCWIKEY